MLGEIQKWKEKLWEYLGNFFFNREHTPRAWTVPLVLLAVSLLSFGLYARQQGYYWDDWGFAWAFNFRGFEGLKDTFSLTRPLRAYIDTGFMTILGVNPFAWQIFAIVMRTLTAISLWWLLRMIWTKQDRPVFVVSLLFLIYPGFSQQAIALTYYYFWLLQAILFLSLGLMILAARKKRYFGLTLIIALLLSIFQLFSSEHFFGVELLRPIFLWFGLAGTIPDLKKRLGRAALLYTPFALILVFFLYWRFFIFKFPGYELVTLTSAGSFTPGWLTGIMGTALQTFVTVTAAAWSKVIQVPVVVEGGQRFMALYPLVLALCLIGLIIYQNRFISSPPEQENKPARKFIWHFLVLGIVSILVAGIPYYFANLPVWVQYPEDRFTLSFALGVSLLLTALLELLPGAAYRITLTSALVALAVGLHFYTGFLYRNENDLQKTFLWQLTWRVPALRPGSLLLIDNQTFSYSDDEGLSFALNWIYSPENNSTDFHYAIFDIPTHFSNVAIEMDMAANENYLSTYFSGSTNQAIAVFFSPPSCLRILNPDLDIDLISIPVTWDIAGQPTIQEVRLFSQDTLRVFPLSNLDVILTESSRSIDPPAFLFGSEPKHNWCYLFETADLARQVGDWQKVASLGDEATDQFYYPADLSEYLPFIEAYAHTDRWEDAWAHSQRISAWAPVLNPALCGIWERAEVIDNLSEDEKAWIMMAQEELRCANP